MAFAGGFGATFEITNLPCEGHPSLAAKLLGESNTRFLCEVRPENATAFEDAIAGATIARIGRVTEDSLLVIRSGDAAVVNCELSALKEAWQKPLRW